METIGFGTSGLRGPAALFTPELVGAHVRAFLKTTCATAASKTLAIGCDRRASSPQIAALVAGAAKAEGFDPIFCGELATPALAGFALGQRIPAIMVTGSHIPARYNGLKFYRPDGELRKSDEAPIRAAAETLGEPVMPALLAVTQEAATLYRQRALDSFPPDALAGLRLGLFAHSAVGSDALAAIVTGLGADCMVFGQSAAFVAVDTEAVAPDHLQTMRDGLSANGWDAVISTDGDGDRPLLLDASGNQINGDIVGALAARALGATTVVTPLTSTSAIEKSGWFDTVVRTKIGSPHVVAAMADAQGKAIVGFEANGGFLVQTPLAVDGRTIAPLPTRDAVLPLLAVLADARRRQIALADLVRHLPPRAMLADRLPDIASDTGKALVEALAVSLEARRALDPALENPLAIDRTDGTRLTLLDNRIVHFRQSGNAPELRCYVEADTTDMARQTLDIVMARLKTRLEVAR